MKVAEFDEYGFNNTSFTAFKASNIALSLSLFINFLNYNYHNLFHFDVCKVLLVNNREITQCIPKPR